MAIPQKPLKPPLTATNVVRVPGSAQPVLGRPATMPWTDLDIATSHGSISVRLGHGEGVPVLFLHGNSADKDVFSGQMGGRLRDSCRMIALDLPGHGASQNAREPSRTYSISGYADAIIEVLEALDLTQVVLVGWSLGGHIALELAARYPGVLGIMLTGTPPVGVGIEAILAGFVQSPGLLLAGKAEMTRAEVDDFALLTLGSAADPNTHAAIARTDGQARALMYADLLGGGVPDQRAFVEGTAIPIAIVNGDDDPIVDVAYLKGLRDDSLWYRRIHLIRGGGHAPFRTRPKRFDAVLGRFIASMRRRHRAAIANPDLCFSG